MYKNFVIWNFRGYFYIRWRVCNSAAAALFTVTTSICVYMHGNVGTYEQFFFCYEKIVFCLKLKKFQNSHRMNKCTRIGRWKVKIRMEYET